MTQYKHHIKELQRHSRTLHCNISKAFSFTIIYSCLLTLIYILNFGQYTIDRLENLRVAHGTLARLRDDITPSTIQPTTDPGDDDNVYSGYVSLSTKEPLRLSCTECAVVASSGHLIGSNAGSEIDQHQCVIRMNLTSVVGFERDVGARTTIRVVGHRNFNKGLEKASVRHEVIENNKTRTEMIIISWMSITKDVPKLTSSEYRFAFLLANLYPDVPIYSSLPDRMVLAEELFKKETGFTRKEAHTTLTTGWYTMVHAMELCSNITVYGMAYDDFCSSTNSSVPYHYYEPKRLNECAYYNKSENRERSGHLFITEKAIFRRWSTYMNITFRHPVWPEKGGDNGTLHTPFFDKLREKNKGKTSRSRRRRRRSEKNRPINDTVPSEKLIPKSLNETRLTQHNLINNYSEELKLSNLNHNNTDNKAETEVIGKSVELTKDKLKFSKRMRQRRKKAKLKP